MTNPADRPDPPDGPDVADAPHVLVVDDDERLRALLTRYLGDNGFVVSAAAGAEEARAHLEALTFDLLVLDVMMPGEDGVSLTRSLRAAGNGVPILMLTAVGDPEARIRGLESGADDYLAKPFEPRELLLRITGILRRVTERPPAAEAAATMPGPTVLRFGALALDLRRDALSRDGQPVHLTTTEAQLLMVLARRAGEVISREDLADLTGTDANPRGVDVQVTRLRRKLEPDPRVPRYLQTVRGRGYLLRPD